MPRLDPFVLLAAVVADRRDGAWGRRRDAPINAAAAITREEIDDFTRYIANRMRGVKGPGGHVVQEPWSPGTKFAAGIGTAGTVGALGLAGIEERRAHHRGQPDVMASRLATWRHAQHAKGIPGYRERRQGGRQDAPRDGDGDGKLNERTGIGRITHGGKGSPSQGKHGWRSLTPETRGAIIGGVGGSLLGPGAVATGLAGAGIGRLAQGEQWRKYRQGDADGEPEGGGRPVRAPVRPREGMSPALRGAAIGGLGLPLVAAGMHTAMTRRLALPMPNPVLALGGAAAGTMLRGGAWNRYRAEQKYQRRFGRDADGPPERPGGGGWSPQNRGAAVMHALNAPGYLANVGMMAANPSLIPAGLIGTGIAVAGAHGIGSGLGGVFARPEERAKWRAYREARRAFRRGDADPASRYERAREAGNTQRAARVAGRHPYVLAAPRLAAKLRAHEAGLPAPVAIGTAGAMSGLAAAAGGAYVGAKLGEAEGLYAARMRSVAGSTTSVPEGGLSRPFAHMPRTRPGGGTAWPPTVADPKFQRLGNQLLPDEQTMGRIGFSPGHWNSYAPGSAGEDELIRAEQKFASRALANPQIREATQARMVSGARKWGTRAGAAGLGLGLAGAGLARWGRHDAPRDGDGDGKLNEGGGHQPFGTPGKPYTTGSRVARTAAMAGAGVLAGMYGGGVGVRLARRFGSSPSAIDHMMNGGIPGYMIGTGLGFTGSGLALQGINQRRKRRWNERHDAGPVPPQAPPATRPQPPQPAVHPAVAQAMEAQTRMREQAQERTKAAEAIGAKVPRAGLSGVDRTFVGLNAAAGGLAGGAVSLAGAGLMRGIGRPGALAAAAGGAGLGAFAAGRAEAGRRRGVRDRQLGRWARENQGAPAGMYAGLGGR